MTKKLKDLNPYGVLPYGVNNRYDEYLNLLLNSVKVQYKDGGELPYSVETFVKRQLFENGWVGYDKITARTDDETLGFYIAFGEGRNKLGNFVRLIFRSVNGQVEYNRPACYTNEDDGAYIITALPNRDGVTIGTIIKETTDFMTTCDIAIRQNVEACKTPYIVVCKNKDLMLSFEQALQQKILGQACLVVSEDLGEGLKSVKIDVDYLADRFAEIRDFERDTLLNKLGIMTANIDKKERVQSAEVNATIGQATDYIYLLIDTFNKQCDTYGLPFEMILNGSLEEIYLNDDEVDDIDVNDVEEEQNIKE